MADRDTIIEAMAAIQAEADCDGILCTHRDCTCRIIVGRMYDAALPLIRVAVLEEAADEAFRWDTGRQASEAVRVLKDTP